MEKAQPKASLIVNQTSLPVGGIFTVSWEGIINPTPKNWLGLYEKTAADGPCRAGLYTKGKASGSESIEIPHDLAPGTYELRLFADNSFTRLAISELFTVGKPRRGEIWIMGSVPIILKHFIYLLISLESLVSFELKSGARIFLSVIVF
ncbi:MAG: hypothetical protein COU90_00410 [Candidatus Ryanbacteria bacterium CG10_big_fil_rev_8_21_14_0_10_43_42]|uniref:Uncharacterized protein n=1 Tax=Candidatus Ryanbacteria bacterium CG10_big_fil_rev_8_21_14_0_10_43_42 TaxID=1974864 RepID=A0A2M8KXW1_9BACT|nr:MAG: hypothetical protein COU90_00410 [Candidatus Ryanbacteria bacterium CG10_big_fil_rev_8_21_14_0_10_43_42]